MSGAGPRSADEFARVLVRFNAQVLGVTTGLIAGVSLCVATLILVAHGGPNPGQMLSLLHHFFPGYRVSVGGAFIGALWAGAAGYLTGFMFAYAYGPWLLRGAARRVPGEEDQPGRSVLLLSPLPIALVTGAFLALGLFAATNLLWFQSAHESPHLALLGHYLPGYATDFGGSVIGAFWVFPYGSAAAGCVAWIYNRIVTVRFPDSS